MGKVVACYKWVVDEAEITIKNDLSVNLSGAKRKISDYDRNAIEAAVRAAKEMKGQAVGLSYGGPKTKQSVKEALARGLEEVCWINDAEAEDLDTVRTAQALAGQISKMEDVSLIICSEGSSDTFARQTAPRLAAALGWPCLTAACGLQVSESTATVSRKTEKELETYTVQLPAVVSVAPEICEATIPSMMAIVKAGKKPQQEIPAGDLGLGNADRGTPELQGYLMDRKNIVFKDGDLGDKLDALVQALKKEGVL